MSQKKKNKKRTAALLAQVMRLPAAELTSIVDRLENVLSPEEHQKLKAGIGALAAGQELLTVLRTELQGKSASLERLRRVMFGVTSEKTAKVLSSQQEEPSERDINAPQNGEIRDGNATSAALAAAPPVKRKGHGRNGASAFTGAEKIKIPHPYLAHGEGCPNEGCLGKVYLLSVPKRLVRIKGMAPLCACVYELDRLRCNLCQEVFTAPAPAGVGDERYDETAAPMIGMIKYGAGLPFNRNEQLQAAMGIPLPASTQWDLVKNAADDYEPVHEAMIDVAADGEILYNDDTTMKVLKLTRKERAEAISDDEEGVRTGVFTSGIVSTREGRKIALFFTGPRHAGENLAEVLKRRSARLPAPIQMCDALSHNNPGDEFETILCRCLAHGRRKYVEVVASFPEEVAYVLNTLREVYRTDAKARALNLTPDERLALHQHESGPRMAALEQWMVVQFEEKKIEPNSTLGDAIKYCQDHWHGLTQFLRVAGAPLDNNITERALKKAILHRKNSLFYRTLKGAAVGDRWMSLYYTAELNGIEPFGYLVALLRHREALVQDPHAWMPWNYQEALAKRRAAQCVITDGVSGASEAVSAAAAIGSSSTRCHSNGALA